MTPETFRERRRRLRLTQAALASEVGVDSMTVSRWERGLHPIPKAVVRLLGHLRPKRQGATMMKAEEGSIQRMSCAL